MHRWNTTLRLVICLVAFAVAGCSEDGDGIPSAADAPLAEDSLMSAALRIEATSCGDPDRQLNASAVIVQHPDAAQPFVLTVAHVFDEVGTFRVLDSQGLSVETDLVAINREIDLAVLTLSDPPDAALVLSEALTTGAQRLLTYRDAEGPQLVNVDIVGYLRVSLDGRGERDGIELQTEIKPGDSGGPIVDERGEILGLAFATNRIGDEAWATASSELETMLTEASRQLPAISLGC